jgi:hypothetical protein
MRRRRNRAGLAAVLGVAMLGLCGGVASADTASCEIPIIHALPGVSSEPHTATIDPQIGMLRPYLSKPPFTSWHEFKLLERKTVQVEENASAPFILPNNRQATLTFLGHTSGPGEHRMRLRLIIDHTEKKHRVLDTTFTLDEGGVVLHVGQHYEGGVLVFGVSCKTHN